MVPKQIDHGVPRDWANALNEIRFCEGKEPEPTSEGATAVVRNATQNLQKVQMLRGDSGGGVLKNLRQCRVLIRLEKRGRTNAKFKPGQGCVAQWSRDREEETAKPSALHIEYAPRGIPLLFKLMGHSDGSENRNVQRQSKGLNLVYKSSGTPRCV